MTNVVLCLSLTVKMGEKIVLLELRRQCDVLIKLSLSLSSVPHVGAGFGVN